MVLNKCPISLQMVEVQFVLLQFRTVFFYLTVKSKCVGHRSIFKRSWHQIKLAAFCGNYFLAKMKVKNPGKLTFSSSLTHFSSGWFFFTDLPEDLGHNPGVFLLSGWYLPSTYGVLCRVHRNNPCSCVVSGYVRWVAFSTQDYREM